MSQKTYINSGGPKGIPVLGMILEAKKSPIPMIMKNSLYYGDIVPFHFMGVKAIQLNHPDLIKYVLMENHKNYRKSDIYIRFESVLGQGLLTSSGDKWKRDRQKIQPMFKREQVEGYYFEVINEVGEKFKRRWLALTEKSPAEIDVTKEMATITIEIILKAIFGKDNLDDATIASIHHSFVVFIDYLKDLRLIPKVDFHKLFHTPRYSRFKKELDHLERIIQELRVKYQQGTLTDKYNMLALLFDAQKQNPDHFTDKDIMDQALTMVFGGFESTSIFMQWMWYMLDARPDMWERLRADITQHAPETLTHDSTGLTHDAISKMDYLDLVFKETLRLYPPFWISSRQPLTNDVIGGYKVDPKTVVILPQIVMQRHPRYWDEPNAVIPERFLPEREAQISEGLYFPFSHGPRKCSGYKLVEMEAKIIFAKLLPLFKVVALNSLGNELDPGISLKLKMPLRVEIRRV